jgi:hypothetical protein
LQRFKASKGIICDHIVTVIIASSAYDITILLVIIL